MGRDRGAKPGVRVLGVLCGRSVALFVLLCGSLACSEARRPPTARHLVLVTLDTLRADRVGVYGGVDLTPRLDRIAREGAYAADAMAHVPLTRPSHATIFSGRLPWELGVRDNLSPAPLPPAPLLTEILKGAGFRTGAFVSSLVLERRGGFARGFDRYDDELPKAQSAEILNTLQRPGVETLRAATAWLEREREADRLFLWIHLFEPHDPYEPPEPYASRYRERPYDGEVAYTDAIVGQLDDALERLGLKPQTLLAVTSDHGEGLGEHEESLHGFFVYQTTLAVPLIFRGPGIVSGARIAANVGLVDVLPTALDLLGIAVPRDLRPSGNSLAAALRDGRPPADRPQYAESLVPLLHFGWSDLRVLRQGSWKYVLAPRPELYDLAADPKEAHNLATAEQTRAAGLRASLEKMLEQESRVAKAAPTQPLPPDLLARLGALGYIGGAKGSAGQASGADPKDKLPEFRRANDGMRSGLLALNKRDYAAAAAAFEGVMADGIESFEVHLYLARSLLGAKRADRAAWHFEQAAQRSPLSEDAWTGWADARLATSGPQAALATLREGRKQNPGGARLAVAEADLCVRLRQPGDAIAAYKSALPLLPKDASVRQRLGELQRDLGQIDAALASLRDAVAVDPANASAWNALGMTLGGSGDLREAEAAFRTAIARDATDHRYVFNMGLALVRQGRGREARPYFEKALQLAPGFAPARQELQKLAGP